MFNSAKISELKTRVEELESGALAFESEKTTLASDLASAKAALSVAESAKTAAEQALASANEAHAKALADAKAEHDAKVESEVISRIASAGIPPIRRDPSASAETGDNTMTREAFVKLSPAAQSQFCLKGGRIQG